jgi:phospholipase C
MYHRSTKALAFVAASAMTLLPACPASARDSGGSSTNTPIKHVVVIFQENVSFDHYFGTYPHAAANKDGSTYFAGAKDDTPRVNSFESAGLLTNNPNAANPFRIDRSNANTCDEDHGYGDEQLAFDGGLMDRFAKVSCNDPNLGKFSTMGYYDGNTVTALWNYAQHFAMSDNSFGTTFGPSTPGLLNLVAGNTFEGTITNGLSAKGNIAGGAAAGAVIGDPDPAGDVCSNPKRSQITMSGQNVGDLLNKAGVTWGSFMGGVRELRGHLHGHHGAHDR